MASELIKLYSYQYFFTENLQIDFMALDFIQDKNGKLYIYILCIYILSFYIGVKAYKTIERELSKPTKPPEELIAHTECNGIFCRTENIDFAGRMMNGLKRAGWQFGKKTPRFTLHREIIDFNLRIELYEYIYIYKLCSECEYVYYGEPNYFPFVDYLVRQADSHKMVKYNSNLSFFCPLPVCEICYQLYLLHNQKIVKMTGKYMPNQITMVIIYLFIYILYIYIYIIYNIYYTIYIIVINPYEQEIQRMDRIRHRQPNKAMQQRLHILPRERTPPPPRGPTSNTKQQILIQRES